MIDFFVKLQENVCATANISSLVKSSFMFNGEHKVVESMRTIKHTTELNYILLFPRAKDGPLELSPRTAAKDGPLEL